MAGCTLNTRIGNIKFEFKSLPSTTGGKVVLDFENKKTLHLGKATSTTIVNGTIKGWTTDIQFSATDYNTVEWTAGSIYYPDGSSFFVPSGSTGDMTTITYIYLNEDTSTLQTTTNADQAVGDKKLLVCVANPIPDTEPDYQNKKAEYQAFGTNQQSTFIHGDTIAGNTIIGNHIVANSLTSREIDASTINLGEFDGNLDDITDGVTYAKIKAESLQDGFVLFDKVLDGSIYGKVKKTALTSDGFISLDVTVDGDYAKVKASALNSDGLILLDKTIDGDYGKVKKASLTTDGLVLLSQTQGTLDDIGDGEDYAKTLKTYLEAGKIKLLSKGETTGSSIKLDADQKLFQLTNTIEDPHGENNGTGETIELTMRDVNGTGDTIPVLDFYDDGKFAGGIYGDTKQTVNIGGTDIELTGIFTTKDLITGRHLVAKDSIISSDKILGVGDIFIYGGKTDAPVFRTENEKLVVNTCIKFSDGTELCSAGNSGSSGLIYPVKTITTDYTTTDNDCVIIGDCSSQTIHLTLGTLTKGKYYKIKGVNTGNTNSWTTKADMPTGRFGAASGVVNGKIYVMGGYDNDNVFSTNEEYDPATDTWATKADMPTARYGLTAGVVNNKIYAIGGRDNHSSRLSTNEEYDPVTNSWATKANMPTGRHYLTCGVVNNKIYAIGGYAGRSANEEYDPATNTWATKADMPTARYGLTAGVVNNKIYAIGGYSCTNDEEMSTNEEYSPITNTWTTKANMPTARARLTSGVLVYRIYAIGGTTGKTNEEYNPATNTWATKADMPTPRFLLTSGTVNNRIYCIGGFRATHVNEAYNPSERTKLIISGLGLIDGESSYTIADDNRAVELICDGENYRIFSEYDTSTSF